MIEFLVGPRGMGKTTHAIEWTRADPNRLLIVHDANERHRLSRAFPMLDRRLFFADQLLDGTLRGRKGEVGVDNADLLLARLTSFAGPIGLVTATGVVLDV